jgi:hypothetical protein
MQACSKRATQRMSRMSVRGPLIEESPIPRRKRVAAKLLAETPG